MNSSLKIILFSNINGDFQKFTELFSKIREKSGDFDLVILTGNVFNPNKNFSLVKQLDTINTKFLIFDQSEVGIVCKHRLGHENYKFSENIEILGRSGFYIHQGLRIAFLSGKENKKYLSEDEKYKYTSCYFSRDDIDMLIKDSNKFKMKTDILLINTLPSVIYDEMKK